MGCANESLVVFEKKLNNQFKKINEIIKDEINQGNKNLLNNKSDLENEINELKTKEKEHTENFKKLQDNMNDLQKRINNL